MTATDVQMAATEMLAEYVFGAFKPGEWPELTKAASEPNPGPSCRRIIEHHVRESLKTLRFVQGF